MIFFEISLILTLIALTIILTKPNLIFILLGLELIFLAININFIGGALLADDFQGIVFAVYLLSVAAADTSIGLAFVYNFYNLKYLTPVIKK